MCHRWSGRALDDYTLKLLILPPKFCPLHQSCINQCFTSICPASTPWKTKGVCGKKSEPHFAVGPCPVILTSAAKLSEVVVNYHNCLRWLSEIHHHPCANKFPQWAISKASLCTLQECLCSTKFVLSCSSLEDQELNLIGAECHPNITLEVLILNYVALTVTAWFLNAGASLQQKWHFSAKFVPNANSYFPFLVMIQIGVRIYEWLPLNISACGTSKAAQTINNRQSNTFTPHRPAVQARKPAMLPSIPSIHPWWCFQRVTIACVYEDG